MDIRDELKNLRKKSDKLEEEGAKMDVEQNANKETNSTEKEEEVESEWSCKANEALNLKLVHSRSDIDSTTTTFHPEYSHQIFDNEKIFGYKGLKIDLYCTALANGWYINSSFQEMNEKQHDDVQKILEEFLPQNPKPLTSVDEFIKVAEEEQASFTPPGVQIHSFTRSGSQGEETYDIYVGKFENEKLKAFHQQIRFFVLLFVDASSYIDEDDPRWEIYLLFCTRNVNGVKQKTFAGYSAVYNFFAYPQHTRKRISQFLVLPPFQKNQIGGELLNAIYRNSSTKDVKDVVVEDPSVEFSHLRNVIDAMNVKKEGFLQDESSELEQETIDAIQKKLKLNPSQIKILHEIFWFQNVNKEDEEEYKAFRLAVKRRLYKKYQDVLSGFEEDEKKKEKQKEELQKIYQEVEDEYSSVIKHLQ